jgi:hypothetical protein
MEAHEVIADLRKQLDDVEAAGNEQVQVRSLRRYLDVVERDADSSQEVRNREHAGMLAEFAARNELGIEMMRSVLEAGKSTLHALLIINGGAVIALLGVTSNLVGKSEGAQLAVSLALPLLQFGIAVLCGALGFAFRYLSQDYYAKGGDRQEWYLLLADYSRYGAMLAAAAGFVLFGFGVVNAYNAVRWSFAA